MPNYSTPDEALAALAREPFSSRFPNAPGVYVLSRYSDEKIWYVGQTCDLRQRLVNHPVRHGHLVRCKVLVCDNRIDVEQWLIAALTPALNKVSSAWPARREPTMTTPPEMIATLDEFAATILVPVVQNEFKAVVHKLRHPMSEIVSKVRGDSLAERARAIGVSRQTVYVWLDERFRPVGPQAKKLAKLTGVPVEHIKEYQNDAGRKVAKKAKKLASRSKAASSGDGRAKRQRGRVVVPPDRGGSVRARGERASG